MLIYEYMLFYIHVYIYGCISMLRYQSSRRYYTLRTCFVGRRLFVVNQLPPTRSQFRLLCWCGLSMRGVSAIPRAVSLRVSISQSTGILGIPLPALLSNICIHMYISVFGPRHVSVRGGDGKATQTEGGHAQVTYIYIYMMFYIYVYMSKYLLCISVFGAHHVSVRQGAMGKRHRLREAMLL